MCGLIAVIDTNKKKNVNDKVIDAYENQYKRGEEGFGLVSVNKEGKIRLDRSTEPIKFMYDLHNVKSSIMFAHHRTPTSTENKLNQTHPILVANKWLKHKYLIMHNGVIRNADTLKTKHEAAGFIYTTDTGRVEEYDEDGYGTGVYGTKPALGYYYKNKFNDSESLAIELALFIEGLEPTVEFEGSAAFLVIQINKNTGKFEKFFYGRHINPLNIYRDAGFITIASEGEGIEIPEDIIFETKLGKTEKPKEIPLVFKEKKYEAKINTPAPLIGEKPSIDGKETKEQQEGMVSTWTEDDEEEMKSYNKGFYDESEVLAGTTANHRMEYIYGEVQTIIDDFVFELENEETIYEASIEDVLLYIKTTLKQVKGEAIIALRKTKEIKEEEKTELHRAMGFIQPNTKEVDT